MLMIAAWLVPPFVWMKRRTRESLERFAELIRGGTVTMRRDLRARHALVDRWIELHLGTWLSYRIPTMQAQGIVPTYEANISKLFGSELMQRVTGTGAQLFGLHAQLRPTSPHVPMNGQIERDYPVYVGGGYYGYGRGYYGTGMGYGYGGSSTYDEGTMIVDVIDPATQQIVWRGYGTSQSRDAWMDADRLHRSVTEILKKFPPEVKTE